MKIIAFFALSCLVLYTIADTTKDELNLDLSPEVDITAQNIHSSRRILSASYVNDNSYKSNSKSKSVSYDDVSSSKGHKGGKGYGSGYGNGRKYGKRRGRRTRRKRKQYGYKKGYTKKIDGQRLHRYHYKRGYERRKDYKKHDTSKYRKYVQSRCPRRCITFYNGCNTCECDNGYTRGCDRKACGGGKAYCIYYDDEYDAPKACCKLHYRPEFETHGSGRHGPPDDLRCDTYRHKGRCEDQEYCTWECGAAKKERRGYPYYQNGGLFETFGENGDGDDDSDTDDDNDDEDFTVEGGGDDGDDDDSDYDGDEDGDDEI